jgi:hypothetical protein
MQSLEKSGTRQRLQNLVSSKRSARMPEKLPRYQEVTD